jgi:hypothetical protein
MILFDVLVKLNIQSEFDLTSPACKGLIAKLLLMF